MNILAIGAHPDDIESCCAGTLAKYAQRGDKVFLATATNGNIGSATLPPDEIRAVRIAEAARSAAVIGAEYICLDYDDEMFFEDKNARLAFIDLVRQCKADVILTHFPDDYNPDHCLTSKITNDIMVMVTIPNIKTRHKPCEHTPMLYYFEPAQGLKFVPEEYVDITDTFEIKKQMLACHESQIAWMRDNYPDNDVPFFDGIEITGRYRGMQAGVQYAEGFICARYAFRVPSQRLLPQ